MRTEAETGVTLLQAKEPQGHPEAKREARKQSPRAKEHGPAETLTSDSGLQNCGRIRLCCSKSPSLEHLATAALGDHYGE